MNIYAEFLISYQTNPLLYFWHKIKSLFRTSLYRKQYVYITCLREEVKFYDSVLRDSLKFVVWGRLKHLQSNFRPIITSKKRGIKTPPVPLSLRHTVLLGTLINKRYVLTARHCAESRMPDGSFKDNFLRFDVSPGTYIRW